MKEYLEAYGYEIIVLDEFENLLKDINIEGLSLVEDSMRLQFEEKIVDLSKNEYKVLKLLMSNCGKVITREEVIEALWDDTTFVDDNTLSVNITRVKKKIKDLGNKNSIFTKRGVEYAFN